MPYASLANHTPRTPAEAVVGRSGRLKVTGKLRVAIEAMVFKALPRDKAAAFAGLTEQAVYAALRKPHVCAFYDELLEVLRTSERARNLHTLYEVRDGTNQMARVQAVRTLERQLQDDDDVPGGRQAVPGFVINVVVAAPGAGHLIGHQEALEPNPLIEHEVVRDE